MPIVNSFNVSFFTYKATPHLDKRHTIFGKIVGGFETLDAMERSGTNEQDEPNIPIIIESFNIIADPYSKIIDSIEQSKNRKTELMEKKEEKVLIFFDY